jgi:hypothetical protein
MKKMSSGKLRRVILVTTEVSEELSAPVITAIRIGELRITLAVTTFLEELHGVISQKSAFFIVTAVKTSNLT